MYRSPSPLPEPARAALVEALNARLADGLDLHSQIKVAHWNIKGPQFAALHPLFETFAVSLAAHNDAFAERAVTLGGLALGTARHVAARSALPEYPQQTTRDLEHVALLAERIERYLDGLRAARAVAVEHGDSDTEGLFTTVITEFEKHAWFLGATLGQARMRAHRPRVRTAADRRARYPPWSASKATISARQPLGARWHAACFLLGHAPPTRPRSLPCSPTPRPPPSPPASITSTLASPASSAGPWATRRTGRAWSTC